jgi:hypothetical protein
MKTYVYLQLLTPSFFTSVSGYLQAPTALTPGKEATLLTE